MKTDDIRKMGLAYLQVQEAKKEKKEKGESAAHEKGEKEDMDEALIGNQHKIDANKNGKIDAHDFKLLKKKKVAEETELEEASDVTMKQLQKKFDAGTHEAMGDPKPGYHVELRNTKTGKRTMHYVKEEVEQVDEVSKALLRKVGGKMLRKGLSDDPKADKHAKYANLASAKLYPNQYKNSPLKAKVPATEEAEWPVFNRIMEKSDKFTVKYNVSGVGDDPHEITMKFADPNHVKGATKAEPMDDKWSEGEKKFVDMHGGLDGANDSGIHGHSAAAHTAKAATAGVKVAPGRPNDSKIGDKAILKAKG